MGKQISHSFQRLQTPRWFFLSLSNPCDICIAVAALVLLHKAQAPAVLTTTETLCVTEKESTVIINYSNYYYYCFHFTKNEWGKSSLHFQPCSGSVKWNFAKHPGSGQGWNLSPSWERKKKKLSPRIVKLYETHPPRKMSLASRSVQLLFTGVLEAAALEAGGLPALGCEQQLSRPFLPLFPSYIRPWPGQLRIERNSWHKAHGEQQPPHAGCCKAFLQPPGRWPCLLNGLRVSRRQEFGEC